MIQYNTGILYAKTICDFLAQDEDFMRDYYICVHTFNNGRENGYMLSVDKRNDYSKTLYLWIHEHRNSDACVVQHGESADREYNNMYSEKVYYNQSESFEFNPYKICKYIKDLATAFFDSKDTEEK